jgi:hypothetical protein
MSRQSESPTITTARGHAAEVGDVVEIIGGTGKGHKYRVTEVLSETQLTIRGMRWYELLWARLNVWLFGFKMRIVLGTYDRTVVLIDDLRTRLRKRREPPSIL